MAQWKETLEPYIKVYERIRTTTIVPTAGEDLIIGATIISDSGPSYPVLITSQREFLNTFASQEITKSYIDSLDNFYKDEDKESPDKLASTMWLNAYRLAGSTNMLIVRATKGADMNYVVPAGGSDEDQYIVRDGQLLQRVTGGFSLTLDRLGANASNKESGWAISVNEIGIIGNLVSDEGPVYEYFAANLRELVEYLNSTSKFFCPNPKYYIFKETSANGSTSYSFEEAGPDETPDMVYFKEVYLAENFIDPNGFKKWYEKNDASDALGGSATTSSGSDTYGTKLDGLAYLLATQGDNHNYTPSAGSSTVDFNTAQIVDPNDLVNFTNIDDSYFVNTYNSNTDIKIRIRKFNHDAVILKENVKPTVSSDGESPYEVLPDVIKQFNSSTEAQKARIAERDFFEVAVFDPSLDKDPLSFCVGNIPGRGDITLDELNDTLKMINLHLDSMYDLGLEYYNPSSDGSSYGRQVTLNSHLPESGNAGRFMPVTSMSTSDWGDLVGSGSLPVFFADEDIPSPASMGGKGKYKYIVYFPNVTRAEALSASNAQLQLTAEEDIQGNYTFKPYVDDDDDENPNLTTIIVKYANLPATVSDLGNSIQILDILRNELIPDPGDYQVRGFNFSTADAPDQNGEIILPKGDGGEGGDVPEQGKGNNNRGGSDDDDNTITGILLQWVPSQQVYKELGINITPGNSNSTELLTVTPDDLMRSISSITEDEVYTTEGLTDLGNTNLKFQTYLCNMAKNENYFYPISTLYSTNYLAIANYRTRLNQDSHKLYTSAPWDIDSGTVGFKFHASPSVIYWEAVSRNRSMNREFASVFGFSSNGQVLYSNPVTEFTKKQRQLLLSRQINTVMWNTQNQTWNMNDCYTMTSENHILNEDGNSRLFIRINKAIPTLLRPLIGRKLNNSTYADAETILKYWFERTILTMQYSVSDYKVTIANLEANDDQARRQNKMYVLVECLFARSLKYVIVYSDALDMGMEFVGEIV